MRLGKIFSSLSGGASSLLDPTSDLHAVAVETAISPWSFPPGSSDGIDAARKQTWERAAAERPGRLFVFHVFVRLAEPFQAGTPDSVCFPPSCPAWTRTLTASRRDGSTWHEKSRSCCFSAGFLPPAPLALFIPFCRLICTFPASCHPSLPAGGSS